MIVRVEGGRELRTELARIDPALRRGLRAAHKAAAQPIAETGRRTAPVRSGRLRRSVRVAASQRGAAVLAGTASRVPYAKVIHFGWPTRPNPDKKWRGGPIKPNPWLYEAADRRADDVVAVYLRRVEKVITDAGL